MGLGELLSVMLLLEEAEREGVREEVAESVILALLESEAVEEEEAAPAPLLALPLALLREEELLVAAPEPALLELAEKVAALAVLLAE